MGAMDNAALIGSGYEAFSKGDMEALAKLFAPGIRWHVAGRNQIAGTYEGPNGVFAFLGKLMEITGGTFSAEIHDLLASDDHVAVLVRERARRGDAQLDTSEVHVWHVGNGLATEFWGHPQDQHAVDAFFA